MAVVEAALILPILLILTFGMIEYSWMFLKDQNITNAARAGARIAATADGTNAQVTTAVSNLMASYNLQSTGYTLTTSPANVSTAAKGTMITVTISFPYANAQVTGMSIFPVPATLHASAAMAKEGH
jgi:Flp pilus assembly protein TadG